MSATFAPSMQAEFGGTPFCVLIYQTAQGRVVSRGLDATRLGNIRTNIEEEYGTALVKQFVFDDPLVLYAGYYDPSDAPAQVRLEKMGFQEADQSNSVWEILIEIERDPTAVAAFHTQTYDHWKKLSARPIT